MVFKTTNFFESLGVASIERIHSQMISWIFNNYKEFKEKTFCAFLEYFGININLIKEVVTCTEYKSIDILLLINNTALVVENKIKSSEHSNQLLRYKEIIANDFKKNNVKYVYLTLGENSNNNDWKNVSYSDLLLALNVLKTNNNKIKVFVDEYKDSIKRLSDVVKDFLENHTQYTNVFTDGSLTKYDKRTKLVSYSENARYVGENQLETIFQKLFLEKLIKALNLKQQTFIFETRGNAAFRFVFRKIKFGDKHFNIDFQFQNGTIKVPLGYWGIDKEVDYDMTKPDDIPLKLKKKYFKFMREYYDSQVRRNNSKSKAYISVSKQYDSWGIKDFKTIVSDLKEEIEKIAKVVDKIEF
ncbi:MAG: PD-(D/E)XK nuclease family protein [Nanoarchaeota archaeon]|nr:PD-(D/E)XK nuclease family protein [Nanoarchaeota archaeon]